MPVTIHKTRGKYVRFTLVELFHLIAEHFEIDEKDRENYGLEQLKDGDIVFKSVEKCECCGKIIES